MPPPAQLAPIASLHCLISYDNKLGGAVHAALNICRYLGTTVNRVESVAPYAPGDDTDYLERVYPGFLKHRVARSFPHRYNESGELTPWLVKNLDRFDVVDIHGVWVLTTVRAARACQLAGKPYFIHAHGSLDPFDLRKHKLLKRLLGPLFIRPMLARSAGVICTAQREADDLETYGADPSRFSVSLPVVPIEQKADARIWFRAKHRIPQDALVVLFLSRVDYKKGLEFLIPSLAAAKRQHPSLWFVLAGSGDAEFIARIKRLAQEAGILPWMTETGFISGADKQGALSAADLFALPSLNENFGIVLVEAMSAKIPLLVSDQVYIHKEIAEARAGLVCSPSVRSCQEALLKALEDPKRLREMGKRGHVLAEGSLGFRAATRNLVAVYATAVQDERVPGPGLHGQFVKRPSRDVGARSLRILRVISSLAPEGGGPAEGIRQISRPLSEMGHEIHVLCADAPHAHDHMGYPIKVHAVGPVIGKYGYCPAMPRWLEKNAARYDAIIISGLWQYHGFVAHRVLSRMGLPYFVFTHGMLDPWFKHAYPLKHLKKWLYWPWAEYRVLRDAKAVIFTSEEEKLLARRSFWFYRVNEVVTTYGTSDPPGDADALSARFIARHPECAGKRIVLFLSRIHEKKGCDLMIEAFARVMGRHEGLHLVMAGPDSHGWVTRLHEQAARLGVSRAITWPGMLQGDMKWGAYYSSEVFCLPSHQENFGIVVAEALACGRPVLISDKVNIWREVFDDKAGFVDADTADGTFRNLENWLALSATDYLSMKERAAECFKSRFHIRRAAERLCEIIAADGEMARRG